MKNQTNSKTAPKSSSTTDSSRSAQKGQQADIRSGGSRSSSVDTTNDKKNVSSRGSRDQ